jgi:nucleoside-diphosphate-sugar epimerase
MTIGKILVTGATGFIGTRLCERLTLHYRLPYRALVRSFTRANRIARLNAEMVGGDLMAPNQIRAALEGCDTVVHLAHSEDRLAPRETANLLATCRAAGVKRFVHISSMSVHGPHPPPTAAREETATLGRYGEAYCDAKAKTEQLAARSGLPVVILRPTVVYGPYSPFVVGIATCRQLTLIDEGRWVCNAVYVDDVCDAIHAALTTETGLGRAFHINGDDEITWRDFNLAFAPPGAPLSSVSAEEAWRYWHAQRPTLRSNFRALVRLLASPEFHRQLSTVPALKTAISWAKRSLAQRLTEEQKFALKARLQPRRGGGGPAREWPNPGRLIRETCAVRFHNDLAKQVLGWKPAHDFADGVRLTRLWMEFARLC